MYITILPHFSVGHFRSGRGVGSELIVVLQSTNNIIYTEKGNPANSTISLQDLVMRNGLGIMALGNPNPGE